MLATLNPRRISSDELVYGNLISSCRATIPFEWLDQTWNLRLSRTPGEPGARFDVEADWGGARLIVRAPLAWLDMIAVSMLSGGEGRESSQRRHHSAMDDDDMDDPQEAIAPLAQLPDLPELLRLAIIEAAFSRTATQIEVATRKRFHVVSSGSQSLDIEGMETLGWQCEADGQHLAGELLVDAQGMAYLATALRAWSGSLGDLDEWAGLPIPLRFAVGWVDLPTRTLADVAPRDVIVLDETWLRPLTGGHGKEEEQGSVYAITVLVGKNSAFQAQLEDSRITVTAVLGDIMADMAQAEILEDEGTLDDVTIRLTFDLGERSVTIAELRSLAPGFTFDLGRELRRSVTIRANGVAVGEGELVDIDGRVGVSVLTLNRFSD